MGEEQAYRLLDKKELALRQKDHDRDDSRKTVDEVFDHSTLKAVYKLMSEGAFSTIEFAIVTGKEAKVFVALKADGTMVAVKIFRTSNAFFKNMSQYITGDPRFATAKGSRRRIIFTWTQKEFRNLSQAHDAGVRVPRPLAVEKNVLVMEYIGTENGAAPMMKDADIEDPRGFCEMVMEQYEALYLKGRLIHADMSEYNVLYYLGLPYLIDMGQAVGPSHPMAKEFLRRDMVNISRVFKKFGILVDPEGKAKELERKAREAAEAAKKERQGMDEAEEEVEEQGRLDDSGDDRTEGDD